MKYSTIKLAAAASLLASIASMASAATVVVGPGNLNGWNFYATDSSGVINTGSGTGDFVSGPTTPTLGSGSAHLQTAAGGGDGSVQLRSSAFAGTRLDSLTSLSYSTYATSWNGSQLPYLTLWLDTDNDGIRDDRLFFEPTYSSVGAGNGNTNPQADVAQGAWQTWNVLQGMVYDENGPSGPGSSAISFHDFVLANPDATIINDAAQGIGGLRFASGFSDPSDNYNTNIDAFTIGTAGGTTVYNFEQSVPEPTTLAAVAGAGLVAFRRRRA